MPSNIAWADALAHIDEKIARAEEEIASTEEEVTHKEEITLQQTTSLSNLRAQRNSFLPVFRLPPETLETIFILGAREYYESGSPRRPRPCVPSWVNVSYVCGRWRDIALSCAVLWTYHFNLSPRWTEEFLIRSKDASLKISCISPSLEARWLPTVLDKLLKQERIRDLRLHNVPMSFLPDKLSFFAPRLKELDIRLWGLHEGFLAMTDRGIPVLQILKLDRCPLPCSLNLSRLNTFSICDGRFFYQSMLEFLAALRNMESLTILHIDHSLPSTPSFFSSAHELRTSPKTDLSRLRFLAIIEPLSTVVAFLSCVNIPLKIHLTLKLLYERGSTASDYAPISSFLAQKFNTSEGLPFFRSLIIGTTHNTSSLTFSFSERDCRPRLFGDWSPNILLKVWFAEEEDEDDSIESVEDATEIEIARAKTERRVINNILCSLPLTHVTSLHFVDPYLQVSDFWGEMLGCLGSLRYIKLSDGCVPEEFVHSLVARESKENPDGPPGRDQVPTPDHIPVPALEELELYKMTLMHDDNKWVTEGCMSRRSLLDALSARKRLRLTMTECRVGRTKWL